MGEDERLAREQIAAGEEAERAEIAEGRKVSGLFDVRRIIGALLGFYGVVLLIYGIVGSEAAKTKASGVNINLWTGLGLLIAAAIFIGWSMLRPLIPDDDRGDRGSGRLSRAHS